MAPLVSDLLACFVPATYNVDLHAEMAARSCLLPSRALDDPRTYGGKHLEQSEMGSVLARPCTSAPLYLADASLDTRRPPPLQSLQSTAWWIAAPHQPRLPSLCFGPP